MAEETQAAPSQHTNVFRVRAARLDVVTGPDAGRSARLEHPIFVVGSGHSSDLRLNDAAVSREHVRLSLTASGVHVRDEGSRNGTWIGGVRITDALLTTDTSLTLGGTTMTIRIEAAPLDLPLSESASFGGAIGESSSMRHLFSVLERAAPSEATILLEGESGVGKEVLACAVHERSARAEGPFVPVDCGSIPAGLIEAELFGHERGAFTGANEARAGVFEHAKGGTLFLDEIGELPLDLQPKLLRVLEQREVRPLGSRVARPIDVRIVAATNRRLSEAAQKGEFRRDLYYRLAVVRVAVPPLRDRREDIPPLARHLFRVAARDPNATLPADFEAMLRAYSWPGNVRELRNAIERYALFGLRGADELFEPASVGSSSGGFEGLATLPYHEARRVALDRFEQSYLPAVLARADGVVARAAELAEVARPSFYRMIDRVRGKGT